MYNISSNSAFKYNSTSEVFNNGSSFSTPALQIIVWNIADMLLPCDEGSM